MWHVRLVLLVLINAAVILFALANLRETVTLRWWSAYSTGTQISLTAALVVAYLLGLFTLLIFSAFREIRLRRRCARMERLMHTMREELNALRTAAFEEPLSQSPPPSPDEPQE
ncbi:MAG: lipopolysaccharide assembly protein LapA domain-containing protein [Candidatus Eisenbacteria bacterium]